MSNPTVLEIVEEYLKKDNFDGLYNSELECGCPISNLNPCGNMKNDCTAGYKVEASKTLFGDEYDYYICETKENKE